MTETWHVVTTLPAPVPIDGREWTVIVEGLARPDATWAGRLVFVASAEVLKTEQETSQPNREALEYWASGLERVYLEGALLRAH